MNVRAAAETTAVALSAPVTLATAGWGQTLISLGVGLIGVWLARIVFVNRENRRLEKRQPFEETLPVTLAACLIAGAIIYDQQFGISAAAFTGLGVGWTTVVILELAGDRAVNALRVMLGMPPTDHKPPPPPINREIVADVPDDQLDLLDQLHQKTPDWHRDPPSK